VVRGARDDTETDHNLVEKRRIGERQAECAEIIACVEDELVHAGPVFRSGQQRLRGAPVGVGDGLGDRFVLPGDEPVQFDADAGGGSTAREIENVS